MVWSVGRDRWAAKIRGWRRAESSAAGEDTDEVLLRGVAGGDQSALAALYRRHGGSLLAYLTGLTGDHGVAEELVQNTLLAVWRAAPGFRGQSSVRTWLFAIGRRQAAGRRRRDSGIGPVARDDVLAALASGAPGPEAVALARAEFAVVQAAVSRLSTVHREVLHLVFVEGLSFQEIAMINGVPVGTVKSRLSNARRALAGAVQRGEEG